MRDAIGYLSLLDDPNVKAFLHTIRVGEGTADPMGYRRHFGGSHFDTYADHPRRIITAGLGSNRYDSSAAGAYQFLSKTWTECATALGLADFSPRNQDAAALFLIDRRRALDDVIAGRFEDAVKKCAREWASLPGSPYGQPTKTMYEALTTYTAAGGLLAGINPQPIAAPNTPEPIKEPVMLPFIAAALPALIEAAPALIRIFGESPRAEKNAQAAEVVAEIAKQATGKDTLEGAVNAINSDPEAAAAYREAVHQNMDQLFGMMIKAHDADEKSRTAAVDRNLSLAKATGGKWLWLLGSVALIVIVASYVITWQVLFGVGVTLSDETKALLIGQIVIFGFATVLAFLFGSNIQNRISQQQKE
jgi:muramidase (phage lysozyme)